MDSDDILFWPNIAKVGIVPCDSKNREFDKVKWGHYNFNEIDYEDNIKTGVYNLGLAIKLGRCLDPLSNRHIPAFDFDGWNAVVAWFGSPGDTDEEVWDKVIEAAKKTRIEWHQNKGRLHMLLFSNRPITKKRIHIKDAFLEIRYDELLVCSPSINKDGNPWTVLGTSEIATFDNIQLLTLEAKIESLCENYMSDDNKKEYIEWLENIDNWKSIGVGEGRHPALVTLGSSYYYRYRDEWHDLTDDQRKERLWERNLMFTVPKPEEEFNNIWKWIIDKHRKNRDEQREKWEYEHPKGNTYDSPGCVSYKIGANKYIVGTANNQLAEAKLEKIEDKTLSDASGNPAVIGWFLKPTKIIAACKCFRITEHRNPASKYIELEQRYTIEFRGSQKSGNFIAEKETLKEIASRLKDRMALVERGVEQAIIAQILGFEERGMLEYNDELPVIGFILSDNGVILASNIEIKHEIDKAELKSALEVIDQIAKFYENDLDLLATILKWAMVAPISFVIKCVDRVKFLKYLHFHGIGKTGKTTSEEIALAIDGHHTQSEFILSINDIDTPARLGSAMSETTFPKLVDEVSLSTQDQTKYILRDIKIAIDHVKARSKFVHSGGSKAKPIPALCALAINSNGDLPNDAAYVRRVIDKSFSQSEAHLDDVDKTKEFRIFSQTNFAKLAPIGAFRNWLVMNQQDSILRAIKDVNIDTFTIGYNFWVYAYEHVGLETPEWLSKMLATDQFENSIIDTRTAVLNAFQSMINNCLKNFTGTKHFEEQESEVGDTIHMLDMQERLKKVVDRTLLPCIKKQKTTDKYMIDKGVLQELYKNGATPEQVPGIQSLAEFLNIEHIKYNGKMVAKGSLYDIAKNFDLEEETEESL